MSTTLEKGKISIHTENIFPIIKKSLYTDHEIFLRELVSNGVDAIAKLKMVARTGEYSGDVTNPEIEIKIDKENQTLSITDNGIGMTVDEIKKYINQVASPVLKSSLKNIKVVMMTQYWSLWLGFYSSFMVAKKVEIDTLSYQEGAEAVHWSCDGSPEFELSDSPRTEIGTTITLTLQDEEQEYLETTRIKQLIKTYCDLCQWQ